MHPLFSGLSLVALSVLLWRRGVVTRWVERRRLQKQMRSAAFWTAWTPKNAPANGTLSPAAPIMDDVAAVWPGCDSSGHEHVRATYIAIKDAAVLQFCDRCTHQKVNTLVSQGFDLTLLPGAREAVAHG